MNTFERAKYSPAQTSPEELSRDVQERVTKVPEYAQYSSINTGVPEYPADITMAGLDRALGGRITRLLLLTDAESTLHMGAQVLAGHSKGESSKDLQAGLMVNVVKEMAQVEETAASERRKFCEDILRRCTLEPEFKQKVRRELIENNAIQSPYVADVAM